VKVLKTATASLTLNQNGNSLKKEGILQVIIIFIIIIIVNIIIITWCCLADWRSKRSKASLTRLSAGPSYDCITLPSMPTARPSRYVSSQPCSTSTRSPNLAISRCMSGNDDVVCLTPRRVGISGSAFSKKSTLRTATESSAHWFTRENRAKY